MAFFVAEVSAENQVRGDEKLCLTCGAKAVYWNPYNQAHLCHACGWIPTGTDLLALAEGKVVEVNEIVANSDLLRREYILRRARDLLQSTTQTLGDMSDFAGWGRAVPASEGLGP